MTFRVIDGPTGVVEDVSSSMDEILDASVAKLKAMGIRSFVLVAETKSVGIQDTPDTRAYAVEYEPGEKIPALGLLTVAQDAILRSNGDE